MNARIQLTQCPHCRRPLAAVTVGSSNAVQWLPIDDHVIDLAAEPLVFCPFCRTALPCLNFVPAAAPAAQHSQAEPAAVDDAVNPWEERAADYAARPLDYRGLP